MNQIFSQRFFGVRGALGRVIQTDGPDGRPGPRYEIVGVVGNTKQADLREPFAPMVYLANDQNPSPGGFVQILLSTRGSMADARSEVALAIAGVRPDISFHFHDFQDEVRYSVLMERLVAIFTGLFAAIAALLAVVGVYGLVAYAATLRTNEVGIRLALGADRRQIVGMFLAESAVVLTIGLTAGVVVAIVVGRFAGSLLFGVRPYDAASLASAATVLAVAALMATALPARRAARTDPATALRCE